MFDVHNGYRPGSLKIWAPVGSQGDSALGISDNKGVVIDTEGVLLVVGIGVIGNNIENFWSLLKRGLNGTYVAVEPFHMDAYVDEQVFRYNTRKDSDSKRSIAIGW